MKMMLKNFCLFACLLVITGILYPLLITFFAQTVAHSSANGNFIIAQGQKVGARLVGQKFEAERYFWSRPSASDYDPLKSGGSNLGPTNAQLKELVANRVQMLAKKHGVDSSQVPSELVYASGSGLDPHISVEAAQFQINRVAKARGISDRSLLENLIEEHTEQQLFHVPVVNVLLLNMALNQIDTNSSNQNE